MPPQDIHPTMQVTRKLRGIFSHPSVTVILLLLVIIGVLLGVWKPWELSIKATDRTISVTGHATITATPDQFVFSSSYDFTNTNQQQALSDLAAKSNDIVTKLKALGVANDAIKTNSSGYNGGGIYYVPLPIDRANSTYTLVITITLHDAALAQKVQDYLITTNPTGNVSPEVTFSTAKQQFLQDQARGQAEQDARSQADQSAKNLGFKVGPVKSVQDGVLDTGIYPLAEGSASLPATKSAPQLSVQPGQNDLSYSVSVVYYIR